MAALASAREKAASRKRKRKRSASANASWRPEQDRVLAATTAGQDCANLGTDLLERLGCARQRRPAPGRCCLPFAHKGRRYRLC
jgi:hypothetical protein